MNPAVGPSRVLLRAADPHEAPVLGERTAAMRRPFQFGFLRVLRSISSNSPSGTRAVVLKRRWTEGFHGPRPARPRPRAVAEGALPRGRTRSFL
jgi:hypothetical protein